MNSMSYLKTILFDLDGVILNTEFMYMNLMLKYTKDNALPLSKEYYINHLLGKSKECINGILENLWQEKYDEKKFWDGLLKLRQNYLKNNVIEVKEGFYELYEFLKTNNYKIGIVSSNSINLINDLLKNTKIDINKFDVVITRESCIKLKPNSEPYETAIKELGVKKNEVIAIEDSNVGIMSALNAGLNVINLIDIDIIKPSLKSHCLIEVSSLKQIHKYLNSNGG